MIESRKVATLGWLETRGFAMTIRILLADGYRLSREAIDGLLKREGYSVDVVADGSQLLAPYNAVVTAYVMPGMSGLEALRRIRADPRHEDLPVIVFTSMASAEPDVKKEGGIFISKVQPEELIAKLKDIESKLPKS